MKKKKGVTPYSLIPFQTHQPSCSGIPKLAEISKPLSSC